MRLDVIIPTYNRAPMLETCVNSLIRARIPADLEVSVHVVDNNSKDDTRQVVERLQAAQPAFKLYYVFERTQGRSSAFNAGVAASTGDYVGVIDDDEEVDQTWFEVVRRTLDDSTLDFIGGPYLPRWGAPRPSWLPPDYPAVIGSITAGDQVQAYGPGFPGILMGGNAVIRRRTLNEVGTYAPWLGRTGSRLGAGEDEDLYRRLLAAGARGLYLPSLIIYHWIPPERLTKAYHRRWCFWRAVSWARVNRRMPQDVPHVLGVPRYLFRKAARGFVDAVTGVVKRGSHDARSFSGELAVWDLAGFIAGTHFTRGGKQSGAPDAGAKRKRVMADV